MELQNQIYLLIAVFGGFVVLILVLIVVLSTYIRNTRKIFNDAQPGYPNGQLNGAGFAGAGHIRQTGVGAPPNHGYPSETLGQLDYRSNLMKTRNDYFHNARSIGMNRPYREDVKNGFAEQRGGNNGANADASLESRMPRETFGTEISNIFEMDDLDDDLVDQGSVDDSRSAMYLSNRASAIGSALSNQKPPTNSNQYGRGTGMWHISNVRGLDELHNPPDQPNKKRTDTIGTSTFMRDEVEGASQANSCYPGTKEHEPYFHKRRMNY